MSWLPARTGRRELTWPDVGNSLAEHVLILAAPLVALWLALGRPQAADVGLVRVPLRPALGTAVGFYAAYVLLAALVFAILGAPPDPASAETIANTGFGGPLVAYAVIACVLAAPCEELFFRGFLYPSLRRRLAPAAAVLAGGVIFGVAHGPPAVIMLDLAVLGGVLCVIYERTGSLLPCVGVHAAHNAIAFAAIVSLPLGAAIALIAVSTPAAVALTAAFSGGGSRVGQRFDVLDFLGLARLRRPESGEADFSMGRGRWK